MYSRSKRGEIYSVVECLQVLTFTGGVFFAQGLVTNHLVLFRRTAIDRPPRFPRHRNNAEALAVAEGARGAFTAQPSRRGESGASGGRVAGECALPQGLAGHRHPRKCGFCGEYGFLSF